MKARDARNGASGANKLKVRDNINDHTEQQAFYSHHIELNQMVLS